MTTAKTKIMLGPEERHEENINYPFRWEEPSDFLHIVLIETETPLGGSLFNPKGV